MASHDDVAQRWANRILNPGRDALSSHNLHDRGDSIFSYGSHFEVGRILRDRKGNPTAWLLNGNTWIGEKDRPGMVTRRHQNAVRDAVARTGLPAVTIPHAALDVAGIDLRTIEIVDVQRDWWTTKTVTKEEMPGRWEYDYGCPADGDFGGWRNTKTDEIVLRTERWGGCAPKVECDCVIDLPGPWAPGLWDGYCWEHKRELDKLREVHIRARHGVWEEFGTHRRRSGRKRVVSGPNGRTDWDLVDDPTAPLGYVFQRDVMRHWLGASLIKAQVPYQIQVKHAECGGTGLADEPWFTSDWRGRGEGPLSEESMDAMLRSFEREMDRYRAGYRAIEPVLHWGVPAPYVHTECRGCGGRGRVPAERRRTAYFLSGFDQNETRPSYFFCELPPKVRPATVEEALETLKPQAVKLAEQAGREVKRQGDIFAIPMPGVTLRELKKQGGVHVKRPRFIVPSTGELWSEDYGGTESGVWSGPRPNLLGTNHEATEIVLLGGQTYARGTITHNPAGRRPDHKRTPLGREWHMILKNTVPLGA